MKPVIPDIFALAQSMKTKSDELISQTFSTAVCPILCHEKSFGICCDFLSRLNIAISKHTFSSASEEIKFFKEIKPQFLSGIIFHLNCLQIESGKPKADEILQLKHFNRYIKLVNQYNKANKEFYQYYHSGATHLDNYYFRRGKKDPKIIIDSYVFNFDETLSATHEFKVAKLIAYEKLTHFLKNEISKINNPGIRKLYSTRSAGNFIWSDNKVDLVELIYGLYASQSLNNGKVDISELANFFQVHFNVELGDYYRRYLEIKGRKNNPTKFLDSMREALLKKMEEELG